MAEHSLSAASGAGQEHRALKYLRSAVLAALLLVGLSAPRMARAGPRAGPGCRDYKTLLNVGTALGIGFAVFGGPPGAAIGGAIAVSLAAARIVGDYTVCK
jgi:hypothetical protein